MTAQYRQLGKPPKIHAIIACQLLTTITILIAMIWGKLLLLIPKITFFIYNIS